MGAAAISLVAASIGATGAVAGATTLPPIKIGFLYPQTGVFAAPGQYMANGLTLFLQQHHYTLAGRQIQVITADSQGNPQVALTQAEKLVEQDHVNLLFGPLSAAEGAALVPFIDQQHIPTIMPIVSEDDLTQRTISPWIVRTGWTSSQTTQPLGYYAAKVLKYKKVATIGYDFNFGWESVGGFVQTFQQNGGKVVSQIWTPLTTTNYAPYLSQIPKGIDAVMISFSGSAAISFIQQYRQFGLKYPLIAQGNTTDESTLQAEGPDAIGILSALHYSANLQNKYNKAFVTAYRKAFHTSPSYYSEGTYVGGMFLAAGLEAVHGNISNTSAFLAAMHHASIPNAPRGPITMDKYGNPIENVYIRKVEQVGNHLANVVVYTFPKVSQFWTTPPAVFLKHPVYSRTYPSITGP
jgi:branched-chain amino acid transport system substrate-binding protein